MMLPKMLEPQEKVLEKVSLQPSTIFTVHLPLAMPGIPKAHEQRGMGACKIK